MEDKKALLVIIGIGVCALIVVAVGFFWFLPSDSSIALEDSNEKTAIASFKGHDPVEWVRDDGNFPRIEENAADNSNEFVISSENLVSGMVEGLETTENNEATIDQGRSDNGLSTAITDKRQAENITVTNNINNVFNNLVPASSLQPQNPMQKTIVQQNSDTPPIVVEQAVSPSAKTQAVLQTTVQQSASVKTEVSQQPAFSNKPVERKPEPSKNVEIQASYSQTYSESIQKKPEPAAPRTKTVTEYWIQAGSFSALSKANEAKERLRKKGAESTISTREVNGDDYFRVRLGPYPDKNEATKFLNWIKELNGFESSYISEVYIKK